MTQTAIEVATPNRFSEHVDSSLFERLASRIATIGPRQSLDVFMPFTAGRLGSVPMCTPEDVRAAAGLARSAQREWAERPVRERARILLRFHDLLLDRQEEILDILQLEGSKARRHAIEEVFDTAMVARRWAGSRIRASAAATGHTGC